MAQIFKAKTLVSNSGRFAYEVIAPNLVYNTGDQNVSGVKNFGSRPTVNGTGVLLIGEASAITLPSTIVYTTGDQIISGNKTFVNNVAISGTGIFSSVKVSNIDKLFLSGIDVVISGNSSVNVYNDIYISGNRVLTGVDLSSYATKNNLFTTGSILDTKINSLSGYVNSKDIIFSGQIALTGSNLNDRINSLNTLFTGYTGSLDANFATDAQLFSTGSILDNRINTLSGYVNSQDIIFSGQLFNTGSNLGNKINSLSGYVNSQDAVFSGQTFNTGSILNNKINSLSGYVDFSNNNTVFTTGNQLINGTKTFANNLEVQGTGIFNALDLSNISEFNFSGTNINLTNGNVNISGGTLYISGNAVLTGVDLTSYATVANLFSTGSTLDNKINALSGYVNSQDIIFSGQIASTGSRLDSKINALSGVSVLTFGNQIIDGEKVFRGDQTTFRGDVNIYSGLAFVKSQIDPTDVEIELLNRPYGRSFLSIGSDTSIIGPSINAPLREVKIWETGGYTAGPWLYKMARFGPLATILSEDSYSKVGIGTLFPTEKVHISGGNLKVDGQIYLSGNPVLTGIDLSSYATVSNLFATGSTLDNKINSLSGVSVLTFGDQIISGNKTFVNNIGVSGTGVFNAIDLNNVDILSISGVDVSIVNGNVSLTNRPTVNGTGVVLSGELERIIINSGSLLNEKINSLSGYVNSQDLIVSGQIVSTGSILDNKINELSGTLSNNVVYITGNQNINGTKNFYNTPTINGDGILSSGQDIIGGDLTGDLLSSTINKLQGYPINITTPSDGQVLRWDGSSWSPGANANGGGGGGGGLFYYFNFSNHTGVAPSGGLPTNAYSALSLLGRIYDVGSGSFTSPNLTPQNEFHLVTHFVTASGDPGVRNIPAGLWDFNIWANTNSENANQTQMKAVVNIYDPINSSYRYVSESDAVFLYDATTPSQYILNVTMPQTGVQDYERIYVQLFGKKTTSPNRTITFYFDSYRPSHVHTTIPSIAGSGVVKVVDGVYQTPATLIFNTDVDNNANIDQSKIANLTTDLANLNSQCSVLTTNLTNTGSILNQKINSLSGWSASSGNLFSTGSNLDNKINSLSGYVDSKDILFSGQIFNTGSRLDNKINALSGSAVLTYGSQNVYGIKYFYSGVVITGDGSTNGGLTLIAKNSAGTNGLQFNPTQEGGAGNLYFNAGTTSRLYNVGDSTLEFYINSNQYRVANSFTIGNGSDIPDHTVSVINRYGYFGIGSGFSNPLERFHVSGGNLRVDGKILLSGNPVLTGVDLSSYATVSNLFATGSTLDNKINALSGVSVLTFGNQTIAGDKTFSSVLGVKTISGLQGVAGDSLNLIAANDCPVVPGSISHGGDINLTAGTGVSFGNSDYGEINLYAAGPKYNGNINLNGNINVNKVQYFPSYGNPATMASRTINIYKTGDSFQSFVGLTIDNQSISLNDLSYVEGGGFGLYISGVGVTPALYAKISDLFATGFNLDNKINSLSGYVNSQDTIFSGQTFNTGSRLDNKINSLSGYVDSKSITLPSTIVYTTGDQIISGNKTFLDNIAVSGTGNFNNVKVSNIDKLLLSGIDVVISGNSSVNVYNQIYISGNPVLTGTIPTTQTISNVVYTTGNQTISGTKTFASPIVFSSGANDGILLGGSGGRIDLRGANSFNSSPGSNGGNILTYGGLQGTNHGGSITTIGGSQDGSPGGDINTSGGEGPGGSINTSNGGGSIDTSGSPDDLTVGGNITTKAGIAPNPAIDGSPGDGGLIDTSGGNSSHDDDDNPINGQDGGSIVTSNGGGSIDTRGFGSIQLGSSYNNQRTTLNGSASTTNKTITLPNANGTLALDSNVAITGSILNNKINSLSGYVNSQDIVFSGQTFNTGSRLDNKINALSGYVTGITGTFGTLPANLYSTGSILDTKINSLSGYVNSQDIIISGQTFSTGSRLDSKINSLSGYVNSQDIIFSGQIFNTGSRLDNKINNLSGFINDNVVFKTGNQTILGQKTFSGTTTVIGHFAATSKSFLIDHPLDNNKKLQYASLEGPEHGVFLRGKTNENIINLPNYWSALVDENTISVNLTPINVYSNIYVVDYNNRRVITNGNNGNYYFYTIYGERKDIPKLTVEF
jgi:Na+-transporting NADH:ubiquinone oxidoreductase subunit NqrA